MFPVAWEDWSTAANPAAGDSPAYSNTPSPMSADDVAVTVTVSGPPPLVTGAVQIDSSVLSEAVKWVTSV